MRNQGLIKVKGIAVKPEPIKLKSIATHTLVRMEERNISKADINTFINESVLAFKQREGTQFAFYSEKGFAVVTLNGEASTAGWIDNAGKTKIEKVMKIVNKK